MLECISTIQAAYESKHKILNVAGIGVQLVKTVIKSQNTVTEFRSKYLLQMPETDAVFLCSV